MFKSLTILERANKKCTIYMPPRPRHHPLEPARERTPSLAYHIPSCEIRLPPSGHSMPVVRPVNASFRGRRGHRFVSPPLPASPPPSNTPHPAPSRPPASSPMLPAPATTITPPWSSWESLAVNLFDVPVEANTFVLWHAFKGEGSIFSIDLYEDARGSREHKGKVRFRLVYLSLRPCFDLSRRVF